MFVDEIAGANESCDKKFRISLFVIINELFVEKYVINKQTFIKAQNHCPLNNLTNMPNKRLPGLQKFSKIGFTYPQRSAHVGITKGPVRLNNIL